MDELDVAVSISFLCVIASISESKHFVCKCMCREVCSNVAIELKESYTVRLWRWHSSVR